MGLLRRQDIVGARGHWLLEMVIGGQTMRFATAPLSITRADGVELVFAEGLEDFSLGRRSDGGDLEVPITLDASEAWADIISRAHVIERSSATLKRWWEGTAYELARVTVSGLIEGFAYGAQRDPVSFDVVRRFRTSSRMFPTPAMIVDEVTWPTLDERIDGTHYPIVIGCPGTDNHVPHMDGHGTVEGLLAVLQTGPNVFHLLIAGHRVAATSVLIEEFNVAGTPTLQVLPVLEKVDGVGRTISYVDLATFPGSVVSGQQYYSGWSVQNGCGLIGSSGGTIRGAGDVIQWAIDTWTDIRLDASRWAPVREYLNAYIIDTYVNQPVDPMDWVLSEIASLLPVEMRQGEDGVYFALLLEEAHAWDAVARLDADTGDDVQRASLITSSSSQVANEITIDFRPDRSTNRFRERLIIGGQSGTRSQDELEAALPDSDSRIIASYRAKLSQARYGRQPLDIQATAVWDRATAARIAMDKLLLQALPTRFVDYTAPSDAAALNVGDIVVLNDTTVQLIDVPARVIDIVDGGPDVLLHLQLLDDPVELDRIAT